MPELVCSFEVIGTPRPAGSKRHVGGGRIIDSADGNGGRDWTGLVQDRAREAMAGRAAVDGPLLAEFRFTRTRPRGHQRKGGLMSLAGRRMPFPIARPDSLKLARRVEDAMTGIVYGDDSRIVRHVIEKSWGDRDGVLVRVFALGGINE